MQTVNEALRDLYRRYVPEGLRYAVWLQRHKYFGEAELRLLGALADPGKASLDVGANAGVYSHFLLPCSRTVHAFEPIPYLANFLRKHLADVLVHELAVSDEGGEAEIRVPVINGRMAYGFATMTHKVWDGEEIRLQVRKARLDSLDLGPVGFMKIDIEGHEMAALRGARGVITRDLPNLLIEIEARHAGASLTEVSEYLNAFGYRTYFVAEKKLRPISELPPAGDEKVGALDELWRSRKYINNFVFSVNPAKHLLA